MVSKYGLQHCNDTHGGVVFLKNSNLKVSFVAQIEQIDQMLSSPMGSWGLETVTLVLLEELLTLGILEKI